MEKKKLSLLNHTEGFPHVLVQVDGICVLHELSDHLSLVILHHQHLLWLCHPTYHQQTHLSQQIKRLSAYTHTFSAEQSHCSRTYQCAMCKSITVIG